MIPRIVITPGEPAGIGPDVVLTVAQTPWPAELMVVADPVLLQQRADQLRLPIQLIPWHAAQPATTHQPGVLPYLRVDLMTPVTVGTLNAQNAAYVEQTLSMAASLCLEGHTNAVVTGPVQKSIMQEAGIDFSGHTEFFAKQAKVDKTVMLFVADQLKVALATTHLPLAAVSAAITEQGLQETLHILAVGLQTRFGIANPRILVSGLNPHAGENGHLGQEEIATITPALAKLREQGLNVIGPLPADTLFTPFYLNQADAILAMYHDQALPVVKALAFNHSVNVTLGLPFIRTSVDHGTALTLAGSGKADASSMKAALELAVKLCN